MKSIIITAFLLLATTRAEAVRIVFNDGGNEWIGVYKEGPVLFNVVIGNCRVPIDCTYDSFQDFRDFAGNSGIHGTATTIHHAELNYIPQTRQWVTNNGLFDPTASSRAGLYSFRDVPEPSAAWLLLAGSVALLLCARLPRRTCPNVQTASSDPGRDR